MKHHDGVAWNKDQGTGWGEAGRGSSAGLEWNCNEHVGGDLRNSVFDFLILCEFDIKLQKQKVLPEKNFGSCTERNFESLSPPTNACQRDRRGEKKTPARAAAAAAAARAAFSFQQAKSRLLRKKKGYAL